MSSSEKHGVSFVAYNPQTVVEAAHAVLNMLERRGERGVVAMAVAGLLVRIQAEVAGDTIDNTIEVMRGFIDNLERDPKTRVRA